MIILLFFTIFWRDVESACPHRSYRYKHQCTYCSEPHTAEEFTKTHRMLYPGKEGILRPECEGINKFEENNVVLARGCQPEFQEVEVSKTRENQAASENEENIQCKMISLLPLAWVKKQHGGPTGPGRGRKRRIRSRCCPRRRRQSSRTRWSSSGQRRQRRTGTAGE
jgi:hypothetical protein